MTALTAPQFTDEASAIAHVEASRWPDGAVSCPHCGSVSVHRMEGKTQAGYFLCNDCRDKFTCRTSTVMERSHIPVHKWLLAIHLMSSNKNGCSAHELHRNLGITYKSAWFLAHRIREAMIERKPEPMGGEGGSVQADETYYGNTSKRAKGYKRGHRHKEGVVAIQTTNNVENFFLQFKRGMRGTYIHVEPQHLQRYLNEFSFRYSNRVGVGINDTERAALALKGIEGKRLTYRRPN